MAPVTIGKGATLGAGSTITRDVGENELVITRVKQKHLTGWQRPVKIKNNVYLTQLRSIKRPCAAFIFSQIVGNSILFNSDENNKSHVIKVD